MSNDLIKKTIQEILEKLKVVYDEISVVENDKTGTPRFVIKTKESGMLIGPKGEHFMALNHVVKRIITKSLGDEESKIRFIVDINDYHEGVMNSIKNTAVILAERARSFKKDVHMDPMTSYERMMVHSALEGYPEIKTESEGFGKGRHIVIKFVSNI